MPNLNKVLLMGNLTRDPEVKYTQKGTAIADISLAINRVWKDESGEKKEETTFVEVTLWGRTAEIVGEYTRKGHPLFVEGRLQLYSWEDKQTGQKRSKLKVTGENIQLLGARNGTSGTGGSVPRSSGPPASRPASAPPPVRDPDLDPSEEPDDIPFKTRIYRDVRNSRLNRTVF